MTTTSSATNITTGVERGGLEQALRTLKLFGMLETLDARLTQAQAGELGHLDFLQDCATTRSPAARPLR